MEKLAPKSSSAKKPITAKKKSAKLKPAEFAMLMEEMATTPVKPKKTKRAAPKKSVALSVSKPTLKEKREIAEMAHRVSVVCTPWYSLLLSRRVSFFIGLWIGIVGMGLLSLLAWTVVKDQPILGDAISIVVPAANAGSPSTVAQ